MEQKKLAIACQGGGSHTAFTAGVLKKLLEVGIPKSYELLALSGTSGGGICAAAVWYGLLKAATGSKELPYQALLDFWTDNSAQGWWERSWNDWMVETSHLQGTGMLPTVETSPYTTESLFNVWKVFAPRKEYFDLKALLEKHIHFQELSALKQFSKLRLLLGAVDILSGQFKVFDSDHDRISADMILASAAIPNLFKAVEIQGQAYWDGLFSENPPVACFLGDEVDERPDEIWIIRINPEQRKTIPKTAGDILDRRNELSGNLALEQELNMIRSVNQWIDKGYFAQTKPQRFKTILVRSICMSPELSESLDYDSKLDRSPELIQKLIADGEKQGEAFLQKLVRQSAVKL